MVRLDTDKLFIAETALITIPFSLISAFYIVVGLYFLLFLPMYFPAISNNGWIELTIRVAVLATLILSLLANFSLAILSWRYISGDAACLKSVKSAVWAFAAVGAAIAAFSTVNLLLIALNAIESNIFMVYALGAPLLIPFFHLKWLQKSTYETRKVQA